MKQDRLMARIDCEEICRCGHPRYENQRVFGYMRWDERKAGCWFRCDGFADRDRLAVRGWDFNNRAFELFPDLLK